MGLLVVAKGVLAACGACGARNRLAYSGLDKRARCGGCKSELPLVQAPVEIGNAEQFRALTSQSALPVLVDFWAEWCGPCKMVAPELEKVAATAAGKAIVAKLNTEEVPEVAAAFQIASIPNLVLFK